jgi:predicted  nucleic acid-binding Zn-ribbon protein
MTLKERLRTMTTPDTQHETDAIIERIESIQREITAIHNADVESSSELWANRAEIRDLEDEWRRLDELLPQQPPSTAGDRHSTTIRHYGGSNDE